MREGVDKIFGSWDEPPKTGFHDELTDLWHWGAEQHVGTAKHVRNSGTTQRRAEITMLWELYRRARPRIVLEIGCAQGGTMMGWTFLGHPEAVIIGVDRDTNDIRPRENEQVDPHIVHRQVNAMTEFGGGMHALGRNSQTIIPINGWSYDDSTVEQVMRALNGRKIDWLFADSSHQAENFAKEFPIYWPLIASGGVYATHDIQPSSDPNVTKSREWERLKRELTDYDACFEFRGGPTSDSMGIGILIHS